ncbi:DNL-type zinc finger protein [Caerostris darwini]|uniref:DNL-type zinc finger protein n=1 Tax=Caerostris darwini TaxID=1538125 RepID=A0AAV4P905_9ARAC|nr:DNL-type zinc finger protein [Caerostris darwini]
MRFNYSVLRRISASVGQFTLVTRAANCIQPMILQNKNNIVHPKFMNFNYRQSSSKAYEHTPDSSTSSGAIGKIQPKLFLAFTCKICNARIEKQISKVAYTKGVVIVRCDGCEENHLIADNLGWFPNIKTMRNVEDFMEAQGETVKKSLDGEIKE